MGLLQRCAVVIITLLSMKITAQENPKYFTWSQGPAGGCLAGMFAAGIFFPCINSNGVIVGFLLSSIGLYFLQRSNQVSFFLYPLFAVLGCVIIGYVFSMITKPTNILEPKNI